MSKISISVRVPQANHIELKAIASDTGQTVSDLVNEAIARYLGRSGAGRRVRNRLDKVERQVHRLAALIVSEND